MDTAKTERFSNVRLEQAMQTGVDELVTACPYCITNLEDSRLSVDNGESILIKDITEVIGDVI